MPEKERSLAGGYGNGRESPARSDSQRCLRGKRPGPHSLTDWSDGRNVPLRHPAPHQITPCFSIGTMLSTAFESRRPCRFRAGVQCKGRRDEDIPKLLEDAGICPRTSRRERHLPAVHRSVSSVWSAALARQGRRVLPHWAASRGSNARFGRILSVATSRQ